VIDRNRTDSIHRTVVGHLRTIGRHALEGTHTWGTVDVTPGRTVFTRHRVTVFPPGTNARERRALQLHRNWPVAGSIGMVLALILLGHTVATLPLLVAVVGSYVGVCVALRSWTRPLRDRSRQASAVFIPVDGGMESHGEPLIVETTISQFEELDRRLADGAVNLVQYELGWQRIFAAMPPSGAELLRG
jgi:hypothetical protein